MSTSVIHPGTTGATGPSGRLAGLVIAGLAVAIALGFVVANNQANETETAAVVRSVDQDAIWESKIDFLRNQYLTQSSTNIELFKVKAAQNTLGKADVYVPSIVSAVPVTVFSPEAVNTLNRKPQLHIPSIVSAVPAPVFSPELARAQAINSSRLQAMWDQRYQDLIDRFENQMVAKAQAVYSVPWPKGFQDLMAGHEARIAEAQRANWPVGYKTLMDQYAEKMSQAQATDMDRLDPILDREPDGGAFRLPRDRRSFNH
jgi:hypothetical protein